MAKEYAITTAELSCEFGSQSSFLRAASHRHIYVDGYGFANEADITPYCLGSFGSCSSPFRISNRTDLTSYRHIQELRASDGFQLACSVDVEVPWQNVQADVYAAKCKALLEDGWTVCRKGYGIISVIASGQNEAGANAKVLQKIQELERAVDAYMKANGIPEKMRDKLLASVLLWNGNNYNPWDLKSDDQTNDFNTYLHKNNPALYNFFERDISIVDSTGNRVDMNYFIGCSYETLFSENNFFPPVMMEPQKFLAYIDAHNVNEVYHEEMKDLSWSELVNSYYNLDGKAASKADSRFNDYVYNRQTEEAWEESLNNNPEYGKSDLSTEEKLILIKRKQSFSQWETGDEYEQLFSELFKEILREGLETERSR